MPQVLNPTLTEAGLIKSDSRPSRIHLTRPTAAGLPEARAERTGKHRNDPLSQVPGVTAPILKRRKLRKTQGVTDRIGSSAERKPRFQHLVWGRDLCGDTFLATSGPYGLWFQVPDPPEPAQSLGHWDGSRLQKILSVILF